MLIYKVLGEEHYFFFSKQTSVLRGAHNGLLLLNRHLHEAISDHYKALSLAHSKYGVKSTFFLLVLFVWILLQLREKGTDIERTRKIMGHGHGLMEAVSTK